MPLFPRDEERASRNNERYWVGQTVVPTPSTVRNCCSPTVP
jgi:hypothetical protein